MRVISWSIESHGIDYLAPTPAVDGWSYWALLPLCSNPEHNKHTLANHDLIKRVAALRSHSEAVFHDREAALWQQLAERIIRLLQVSSAVQLLIEATVNHRGSTQHDKPSVTPAFSLLIVLWCREEKNVYTDSFSKPSFLKKKKNLEWNTKKQS